MANTVISNAVTRAFRASTYNLGNALSGSVIVNASIGDIQIGTVSANTSIQFGGWAPSGTQSNVELHLAFSNTAAVLSFPSTVTVSNNTGAATIENYSVLGQTIQVTVPANTTALSYRFSTTDCGNTVTIEPINRSRKSTQIIERTPPVTGVLGDTVGTVCVDPTPTASIVTCSSANSAYDYITCNNTNGFYLDMPIVFTGASFEANIIAGTTYYVRSIPSNTTFTLSAKPGNIAGPGAIINLDGNTGTMYASPVTYMYNACDTYDATVITKTATATTIVQDIQSVTATRNSDNSITVTDTSSYHAGDALIFTGSNATMTATATSATGNLITVASTSALAPGYPITFSGTTIGGLTTGNTYYVKTVDTPNNKFSVTSTYTSGVLGANVALANGTGSMTVTYGGIFNKFVNGTNSSNISSGTTYYVKSIISGTKITISSIQDGAPIALTDADGPASGATAMSTSVTVNNVITLNNTNSLVVNDPVIFAGTGFGGINPDKPYYINSVNGANITVSETRYNGIAGQKFKVTTGSGTMTANSYQGTPIWKRTELKPW
jgi:hypothetical protein